MKVGFYIHVVWIKEHFESCFDLFFSGQQAMVMLRFWLNTQGNKATGNGLERALRKCDREDIVNKCIFNVELVTDESEKHVAEEALDMVRFKHST